MLPDCRGGDRADGQALPAVATVPRPDLSQDRKRRPRRGLLCPGHGGELDRRDGWRTGTRSARRAGQRDVARLSGRIAAAPFGPKSDRGRVAAYAIATVAC